MPTQDSSRASPLRLTTVRLPISPPSFISKDQRGEATKELTIHHPHSKETSNQAIITNALLADESLLKDLVRQYGSHGWERVYDQAVRVSSLQNLQRTKLTYTIKAINLTARNIPLLSGRVLIQTSLRHISSSSATIAHARTLASLYAAAGVPRDRFAIKLPFSGAAAAAARVLNAEGIRTLATSVFSLEQGIAASQSGCLFISPYYNGEFEVLLDGFQNSQEEEKTSCKS